MRNVRPVKKTISRLLTLQNIEMQSVNTDSTEAKTLREEIPAPLLVRFDRFLSRGKKGVAVVQNGVCKGCQIRVPVGVVNSLIQGIGIQVCDNCGRYLYLEESHAVAFQAGERNDIVKVAKPKAPALPKTRKPRKASAVKAE